MKFKKTLEAGYTLVEVLVALAILVAVLIPAIQFTAKLMNNSYARDLILATRLAQNEIERMISERDFFQGETQIRLNHKIWRVKRIFENNHGLILIRIQVYKKNANVPFIELKTLRLIYE